MIGGAKAHYDGIKAFSETDLTEDLKSIDVPTLVMQGEDDQVVPYKGAALSWFPAWHAHHLLRDDQQGPLRVH
jgi:pimeloyl-ACP methyl ester carboxylesterase